MQDAQKVIVIVGPTGSGKTALGIAVAERLGGEIISADSMQFYRGMEIGSAAPTPEEQARVKHHFVSCLGPDEEMSAGEFQRRGREVIAGLHAAGKRAVVVGGSGLYVRALVEGLMEGPPRQPEIRARLHAEAEAAGTENLVARLRSVDPAYAAILTGERDLIRIVRALEVYEATGRTLSDWHTAQAADALPATFYGLAWERAVLYARINRRVEAMIAAGWVDEVSQLIAAGYGSEVERLKALGFREIAAHLRGEQTLAEAVALTQMHHRRYAKRQLTWFRAEEQINWLAMPREMEELVKTIGSEYG
jgi:tRNA dimethylallyltransferase